jgi:hypothetical protein
MSTVVLTDPPIELAQCPPQRNHANLALLCVLDAEIEALKGRLLQRSRKAGVVGDLAGVESDRQLGWLQDSMAKLQARRCAS